MEDIKSQITITCQKNNKNVFVLRIEIDEFWFIQSEGFSFEIEGEDLKLKSQNEILTLKSMGNDENLLNFAKRLNLNVFKSEGSSACAGKIRSIFNYNLMKYSLIVRMVDNSTIKISIRMTDKYKNKLFNEMKMKSEFIDYLTRNLMEVLLNKF